MLINSIYFHIFIIKMNIDARVKIRIRKCSLADLVPQITIPFVHSCKGDIDPLILFFPFTGHTSSTLVNEKLWFFLTSPLSFVTVLSEMKPGLADLSPLSNNWESI